MKRNEWEFEYNAPTLYDAAHKKVEHHESRQEWWSKKKEATMELIRSEGIEIDDSLAMEYSKLGAYNRATTVNVRADLKRDLEECMGKVKEHSDKKQGYAAWMEVLASQGTKVLQLNQDDWLYFFGQ